MEIAFYDRAVFEAELEPLCVKENLGVVPYYSLAAGFLTGKYRSAEDVVDKARGGTVQRYLNERGSRILKALDQVAETYDSTPARVALAWLIARPSITAAIASATSLEQLNDMIEATKLELDQGAVALLNRASDEQHDKAKRVRRSGGLSLTRVV